MPIVDPPSGPPPALSGGKAPPIGLVLARTAAIVSRCFAAGLGERNGTLPEWLVLMSLATAGPLGQADLAGRIGIRGATLTHHLNGLELQGLVTRSRLPDDRRAHLVALTPAGRARFFELREAAEARDRLLGRGFDASELAELRALLARLAANAAAGGG